MLINERLSSSQFLPAGVYMQVCKQAEREESERLDES